MSIENTQECELLHKIATILHLLLFRQMETPLLDEGGNVSQVPQATLELAGYGSVVLPDGTGL